MFSTTVTYAVRALAHLARRHEGESVLGRDLAEIADVPANYLSKILLSLKKAGIVRATRGMGGGYCLCRAACNISLAEIHDLFDSNDPMPDCLLGPGKCSEDNPCPAHARWCRVKSTYNDFLRYTTLAEISGSGELRTG